MLLGCAAAVLLSTVFILKKYVLSPIAQLTSMSAALAAQDNIQMRLPENSKDEFGEMAASFNKLLDKLFIINMTLENRVAQRTAALEKSNRELVLLGEVFENSLDGIVITDMDGIIINVNPAYSRITGIVRESAVGAPYTITRSDRHPPEFYDEMNSTLSEKGLWSGEVWAKNSKGRVFPEWISISALHDSKGAITHFVGVFHDISDAKQQESYIKYQAYHDTLTGLP
ncbi:MAG: PAS domain S-box protein, partial [Spirochaetota bacterium]